MARGSLLRQDRNILKRALLDSKTVSTQTREPLAILVELSEARMSGELICASDEAEVHVYLQHGRIAWATDSTHPFAFTRRLREITAIENDTLREILEACKRERRPLGQPPARRFARRYGIRSRWLSR